jgi:hypothetical protein
MRSSAGIGRARWTILGLALVSVLACSAAQLAPATPVVEVTRVVRVPRIAQTPQPIEVTRLVSVTRIVEGPRIEVTRVVPVTQVVEVTRIVPVIVEVEVSAAAPATQTGPEPPTEIPPPTEAPPPAPAPVPPTPPANESLLVWYDFEGDFLTAGSVADLSGNGHDAQVHGTVDVARGVSGGGAILFSGNAYVQAQTNPAAGRSTATFSLWFKTDHPKANYKLASAAWWSGGPGSGWIVATHIPEFWSDDTKSLYLPGFPNNENHFPAGEWVHEVVSYDGQRLKEYTNGQLVNDWPTTGAALGQGRQMAVGGWPDLGGFYFEGSIDRVQLFGRSLTQQEVQALYNQGR